MLKHYPTADEYSATMNKLWSVVRGYCSDDEEACSCISGAIENAFYDKRMGCSNTQAWESACDELGVEQDYLMELVFGVYSLGLEEDLEDEEDEEDLL